jgi:peptidoglycan/xylan/chitin deacetylase (PgdA/CDA1 family)
VKHLIRRTVKKTTTYDNTSIDLSSRHGRVELKRRFDRRFKACRSEPDRQNLLTNLAERLGVDRPTGAVLDEDLKFVDPKDLASLASSALLTVASHAMTHRDLATLSYEEQACELEQSDSLLREHCPAYFPVVAYPNGSLNGNTVSIANRIYKAGFAVFLGSSYRNVYAYPRIGINHNSVQELAYAISPKRLNYILPIKRFLHVMGLRHMRAPAIRQGHVQ